MSSSSTPASHYDVLCVHLSATLSEIKASYRQLLLKAHPDKRATFNDERMINGRDEAGDSDSISALQEAYRVLSNPEDRKAYDATLSRDESFLSVPHSRPAHVVSLDDFQPQLVDNPTADCIASWNYPCRCGSNFVFTEEDLDNENHVVGCSSCSETVYVGFELEEDESSGELDGPDGPNGDEAS